VAELTPLRPADAVDIIEALDIDDRGVVLSYMAGASAAHVATAAEILEEMEDEDTAEVAALLEAAPLAAILEEMETEHAADLLGDLSPDQAESTLSAMTPATGAEVRLLLGYDDDSAGGRMSPDFVALPYELRAADAIDAYREQARDKRGAYYFYAVDGDGRLQGVVSLRSLLTADPNVTLAAFMNPNVNSVDTGTDQETAARLMARYDLLALPVTDTTGRLVGVLQNEDLVDVLLEEATEDMFRLVGVGEEERPQTPVLVSLRQRLPWLAFNLCTQLLIVSSLRLFEGTISRVAVLAVLFPIVTGQGGNVGAQTMTLFVRSMALGELDISNRRRTLWKEVLVGILAGVGIGMLAAGVAFAVGGGELAAPLAAAIFVAMVLNLAAGALAGAVVPLVLDRLGVDPALASAMFVTTVTDTMGVIFFMTAFLLFANQ
jgi:magnesium transporter